MQVSGEWVPKAVRLGRAIPAVAGSVAFHLGFSLQKCVARSLKDYLPVSLEQSIHKESRKEVKWAVLGSTSVNRLKITCAYQYPKKKNPIKVTYCKPSPIFEVLYIPKEDWERGRKETGQGVRVWCYHMRKPRLGMGKEFLHASSMGIDTKGVGQAPEYIFRENETLHLKAIGSSDIGGERRRKKVFFYLKRKILHWPQTCF